jgi:pyruvate,orthophosphate dikinase
MQKIPSQYFWLLDSELPADVVSGYQQAVAGKPKSRLAQFVRLIGAKIPLAPHAYITSSFAKMADQSLPDKFFSELGQCVARFEELTSLKFGSRDKPLLLSVQGDFSGTVRGIGCSLDCLPALVQSYGPGMAYSLFVDFLESYSTLVLRVPRIDFKDHFQIQASREGGAGGLAQLSQEDFVRSVRDYKTLVSQKLGRPFPESPEQHLLTTLLNAAKTLNQQGSDEVFLQAQMQNTLYGHSVKGVAYTRNPFTGLKEVYGVYQSGEHQKKHAIEQAAASAVYGHLKKHLPEIEACFWDVVEAEFVTDEDGHLFFTSFDKAQTTAKAVLVSAMDLCLAGKISDIEAVKRIKPNDVETLLHPTLDDKSRDQLKDLGPKGVTAAPGTAVGHVFFKMADAMEFYKEAVKNKTDKRVILIADELLISDTPGLGMITGLITTASGIASHAAVMARALGIPCMVSYKETEFDSNGKFMTVSGRKIEAKTLMTLEAGSEGKLYLGEGTLQNLSFKEGIVKDISELITRVIKQQRIPLEVRVNINGARDAETGLVFGADGVGLCRTENMFMDAEVVREVRNIIFTQNAAKCQDSFAKLEARQWEDFRKIFEVMKGRVVNIRLMDLPLHDFVPQTEEAFDALCAQLSHLDRTHIQVVADGLREHNPMLGLRACRFGLINPEIYDMQIRAIVRAAYEVAKQGGAVDPGIMFPLVFTQDELKRLRGRVLAIEKELREELKVPFDSKITFRVGSMIELPAAVMNADQLAKVGAFFAFGTNDLTQTTLGISRDDSAHYLPFYLENGILPSDPFKVLAEPVRELVELAVKRGRRMRPDASYGICGEQGGDKNTLKFCLEKGLNYVSCSPFRVLPTRVALVQVAITEFLQAQSNGTVKTTSQTLKDSVA